jgi:hypothetical protein
MKVLLLLWALIMGSSLPAFCQGRDTAFAVHKLFCQKRGSAKGYLATADSAFSGTKYIQQDATRGVNVAKKPDALAAAAFTGVGMVKEARYSVENEAYVQRLYAEGQPIPGDIRRKLRRKHFHVTAHDIVSKK